MQVGKEFFGLRALSGQRCGAAGRPLAVSARAEDETFWREFAPLVGLAGADPPTAGARKIQTKRLSESQSSATLKCPDLHLAIASDREF